MNVRNTDPHTSREAAKPSPRRDHARMAVLRAAVECYLFTDSDIQAVLRRRFGIEMERGVVARRRKDLVEREFVAPYFGARGQDPQWSTINRTTGRPELLWVVTASGRDLVKELDDAE